MNHYLTPAGLREKMQPLPRELFFDEETNSLYIWYNEHWVLIGGALKQNILSGGDNIEIIYPNIKEGSILEPVVRLKDNINIHTWTLGKFSETINYKGFYLLGKIENSAFFPLVEIIPKNELGVGMGGAIMTYINRSGDIEVGHYNITIHTNGIVSFFGASNKNTKINIIETKIEGKTLIGLLTWNLTEQDRIMGKDDVPPDSFEVWFSGWDYRDNVPNLKNANNKHVNNIKILTKG